MQANLFKIKEGKLDTWKEWCHLLNTIYRDDALETLIEEEVIYEAFGIFNIDTTFYTIGIGIGKNLPANISRDINKRHRAVKKECLEYIGNLEMLYELKVKH